MASTARLTAKLPAAILKDRCIDDFSLGMLGWECTRTVLFDRILGTMVIGLAPLAPRASRRPASLAILSRRNRTALPGRMTSASCNVGHASPDSVDRAAPNSAACFARRARIPAEDCGAVQPLAAGAGGTRAAAKPPR